jgi:hypothetical protein
MATAGVHRDEVSGRTTAEPTRRTHEVSANTRGFLQHPPAA